MSLDELHRALGHAWHNDDLAAVLDKHGGNVRLAHRSLVDLQHYMLFGTVLIAEREASSWPVSSFASRA